MKKTRKNADKTRKVILLSAQKLFAKYGYSATSMQEIADKAKINQALLYHHFQNKKNLWRIVKDNFINKIKDPTQSIDEIPFNLKSVITHIIEQRYEIYFNNPEAARIMLWQQLEAGSKSFLLGSSASPDKWIEPLKKLQAQGLIKTAVNVEAVIIWISSSISGAVLSKETAFKLYQITPSKYKDMLINEFVMLLKP